MFSGIDVFFMRKKLRYCSAFALALMALSFSMGGAMAAITESNADDQPVDFTADKLEHDDVQQIITASGHVEVQQNGKIVTAEKVIYDLKTEAVKAQGDVVLMDPNGDVHFAQEVNFTDDLRNGYVKALRTVLADGSRFTAEEGERSNGNVIVMNKATYTACEPCKLNPEKPPVWQMKAGTVTYHEAEHRISYEDATLEVMGVPVAYTPYFSHPDGTIKRKSGFLTPDFSVDSELGFSATPRYYFDVAPDMDATVGMRVFSEQVPQAQLELRKRFENASITIDTSTTYSDRKDRVAGVQGERDEEWRGHFFGDALWNIDDKWRAGADVEYTSDDQYLREYDVSSEDVLENELYAERFSGRDYGVVRVIGFQDVRVSDRQFDQPDVLPEAEFHFMGEPNDMFGGRWQVDLSALGLNRQDDGQDVVRGSIDLGWQRRDISDSGLVTTTHLTVRSDAYNTRDSSSATLDDTTAFRHFAQADIAASFPVVRQFNSVQAVIEPIVSVSVAPNIDNDDDIPNNDSEDVQLDASNIFSGNRFPGRDRVEDLSRTTYGVRSGVYAADGSQAEMFIGQSYRFDDEDNPFPRGSGLDEQQSDIVGQIAARYMTDYRLDYRFQLDSDALQSQRHELDGYADLGNLSLSTNYLYARSLGGTDITQSREQLYGGFGYFFDEEWQLRSGALYDLGDNEGLRRADLGLDYIGQCLTVSTTAQRTLTSDETGETGTEVFLRLGMKNLGQFGTDD